MTVFTMIGALIPTGLLAVLIASVQRRLRMKSNRLTVHLLSWVICSALWTVGTADQFAFNFDRFANGLALYLVPQAFWFVVQSARAARAPTSVTDESLDQGVIDHSKPRNTRSFASWASGLHLGQLIILFIFGVPAAVAAGIGGIAIVSAATEAKNALTNGDYSESPDIVTLAGSKYRVTEQVDSAYLLRVRHAVDSLRDIGQTDYDIEQALSRSAAPFKRTYFLSTRADLISQSDRAAIGWVLLIGSVATAVACIVALWVWFGARTKRPGVPMSH